MATPGIQIIKELSSNLTKHTVADDNDTQRVDIDDNEKASIDRGRLIIVKSWMR